MSQFPDSYPPGAGQDATQPPPSDQPFGQSYGELPPTMGYTKAPPVPAEYGYGQYAMATPPGMHFDQASGLNIPDGTELATVGRRIGAYFLAIPLAIVTLGIGYIVWGLMVWGNGQTPALQVLKMRAWRPETNQVAGFWYMALREVPGRLIDGLLGVITGITSFVLFVTGKQHKALHDIIAGTVVLHDPDKVIPS